LWVRDGYVHWQAGAGVVFDSDPDLEWDECQNKAKVLAQVMSEKGEGDVLTHR
jgi:anthranilate synthase component 1